MNNNNAVVLVQTRWGYIRVVCWGNPVNPPLLTLHGVNGNAESFREALFSVPEAAPLRAFYVLNVIVPDRGVLHADHPFPSLRGLVEILECVYHHFNLANFIGVGEGASGHVLLLYALAHPGQLRSLVLINTTSERASPMERRIVALSLAARRILRNPNIVMANYVLLGYLARMLQRWFRGFLHYIATLLSLILEAVASGMNANVIFPEMTHEQLMYQQNFLNREDLHLAPLNRTPILILADPEQREHIRSGERIRAQLPNNAHMPPIPQRAWPSSGSLLQDLPGALASEMVVFFRHHRLLRGGGAGGGGRGGGAPRGGRGGGAPRGRGQGDDAPRGRGRGAGGGEPGNLQPGNPDPPGRPFQPGHNTQMGCGAALPSIFSMQLGAESAMLHFSTMGDTVKAARALEPRGDNQLRVYWLHNGQPLGYANRFRTFHDFGFCSPDILSVFPQDAGTYQCVAENDLGRAETQTQMECAGTEGLQLDTRHPTSVDRIAQLEAPRPPEEEEVPEAEKQAPFFAKPLSGQLQVAESDNVYLEVQYGPVDDNTLTYEWLINGQPLIKSHRFVLSQDFGFAALNILYMYPEDSGTYSLVIRNDQGQEASSSVEIICEPKDSLLGDTFHPQSVQRIAELGAPRPPRAEAPEPEKKAPAITRPLVVSAPVATETQALHLDAAQYTPTDDNQLVVEWYRDGQPPKQSNRYRLISDFGYASLDINFAIADDAGEYTLVVRNELGEAQTSASIQIEGGALVIMVDPLHPESYRRVLELEAVKPTEPELEAVAPQFTQQLSGLLTEELAEGAPLHMECTVQPINDPKLRIEWLKDGLPLQFSSRIRTIHNFGYVALEFAHIHPEDSGTYTCRAMSEAGEATTEPTLNCTAKRNLYLESQHEQSLWSSRR